MSEQINTVKYSPDFEYFFKYQIDPWITLNFDTEFASKIEDKTFRKVPLLNLPKDKIKEICREIHQEILSGMH